MTTRFVAAALLLALSAGQLTAEPWPRWRGLDGNAVSTATPLPVEWGTDRNIRWKVPAIGGEGTSSPIVWNDRIVLTSALETGTQRLTHCLDAATGNVVWSRTLRDDDPEVSSALTGHAAATAATDGKYIIAFFGNAGVVCYDFAGRQLWHRSFGEFDSELGLASSPIIHDGLAILVCDHDGNRFRSFDSFVIALDVATGAVRWKTERPGLERSWSTPIVVPAGDEHFELIVNAQDELRGYDPATGRQRWQVRGMTGWVTPSPVFGHGLIFAASGKDGPTLAVRPGGEGDVTETHVAWQQRRGAPYVCSPLLYGDHLYVHTEQGVLSCYHARTGELAYRRRLDGSFVASGIAGDGKVYLTSDTGTTYVLRAGPKFKLLASNRLDEETLASPAVCENDLLIRTMKHLYRIGRTSDAVNPSRRDEDRE